LTAINRENRWLRKLIKDKPLDIIISDNRFGLYNKDIRSVFITHQLRIKTSLGKLADAIIQKINYRFINQFDVCWVPDFAGEKNFSGELSHPLVKPRTKVIYIGLLSRINKQNIAVTNKLLILLSGPEPQRSILEKKLLAQLTIYKDSFILVRGLPSAIDIIAVPSSAAVYNYLTGRQLQEVINQSEIIISRSGYSTIMEVLPTGKKCIFIPTPGQAEQEYLAKYLGEKNYACTGSQNNLSLLSVIDKAEKLQTSQSIKTGIDEADKAIADLKEDLDATQ
jgi:UDP-N-acetylglucosamine transferase subunit ALG13